ncbi:MAG: hypothetical protein DMG65_09495 [Candidatus Angelobacter sp. Gp1-AA117]|nr:MAG: hypothetical protein DMG65_09495 [Candidatus Angelobacter sp. Gp1-AA117]
MKHIEELKDVIRKLHSAEATHVESVPIKEQFQGQTVWDGIVEVFHLRGHPKTDRVYAWSHETDNPQKPKKHVTILHVHPVTSPQAAVRAAIIQEYRNAEPAES